MSFDLGGYVISFNQTDGFFLRFGLLLFILILIVALVFFFLSDETKLKVKEWIGFGFWGGFGLLLFNLVLIIIISIFIALLF